MTRRPLSISDHALIRHMERVMGLDIASLRLTLADRLDEAAQLGASAVTIDRHTYMIVDGVCTTVIRRGSRNIRLRPEREARE